MDQKFDFDDNDGLFSRSRNRFGRYDRPIWQRRGFWGVLLIAVAGIFVISLLVGGGSDDKTNDGELPLVTASHDTFREEPQNPGGSLATQPDSTLFETMRDGVTPAEPEGGLQGANGETALTREQIAAQAAQTGESRDRVMENLLAARDEPVLQQVDSSEAPEAPQTAATTPPPASTTMMEEVFASADTAAEATEKTVTAAAPATVPTSQPAAPAPIAEPKVEPAAPAAAPAPKAVEAPAATQAALSPSGDSRYMQIASIREEAAAAAHWAKLQSGNAALGGMQYRVVRADLGERGTYYRIQAGPVDAARATTVCAEMNAKASGSCLIVKP